MFKWEGEEGKWGGGRKKIKGKQKGKHGNKAFVNKERKKG